MDIGGREYLTYLLQLAFSHVAVLFAELSDSALPACGFGFFSLFLKKESVSFSVCSQVSSLWVAVS